MALALFDLDNTLLNGDSDHAWGMFLADIGAVNAELQRQQQDYFYDQYKIGKLDMDAYLAFQLQPLTQYPTSKLFEWRQQFITEIVRPMVNNGKPELLEPHRQAGDTLVIITATNDFITKPIAELLGVQTLLATTAEVTNGIFTGKGSGTHCFQEGKITRLNQWLKTQRPGLGLARSYFYSDSYNDLPLLKTVDSPIVVTPDAKLRAYALQSKWKIID